MVDADIPNMKSQNFEFLRPKREVLADLAGFAERYAHEDPASSLIKQRSLVEHVVTAISNDTGFCRLTRTTSMTS